jgi:hypothetical protein
MKWFVIATLNRGALTKPEQLSPGQELLASASLYDEWGLGSSAWKQRWQTANETPEVMFA